MDQPVDPDISVLIATYNRSGPLRRTLELLCQAVVPGIAVDIVVIDNNSSDDTRAVIEEFAREHPVRYLFEPRPGKNCALNRALDEGGIGRLVVFTDDDVDFPPDYFQELQSISGANPEVRVFGGRVDSVWPVEDVPGWATDPSIIGWGFPYLYLGDEPCDFPEMRFPAGPNFWVRREVFADGLRYNEAIGPRPTNRIMGSETSLLKTLRDGGDRILYCPSSVVGHRVAPAELAPRAIRRRAFRNGRTSPHLLGLKNRNLLARHRHAWRLLRALSMLRYVLVTGLAFLHPGSDGRTLATVRGIRGIAYNLEALRVERASHADLSSA